MIKAYGTLLQGWMAQSKFRDGCPITTTLLETAPQLPDVTTAGREAFEAWCGVIAKALLRDGFSGQRRASCRCWRFHRWREH